MVIGMVWLVKIIQTQCFSHAFLTMPFRQALLILRKLIAEGKFFLQAAGRLLKVGLDQFDC